MGLFDKIFGKKPKQDNTSSFFQTLTAYTPSFTTWDGSLYENALVRASIDARARHMSKLAFSMKGAAKPKLKKLLIQAPNDFQTWSQFLYRLSTILDMQNTAFIVPMLNDYGDEVTGYYPVLPSRCEVVDYQGQPWLRYQFLNGEKAAVEMSLCAIMTKYQYKDDFFGEENTALSETMDLINIQNQGIKEAVKNSNSFRFMARMNNFANDEDLKKERQRFSENNFRGEGGGLLLFPNVYDDIKQIDSKSYTVDHETMEQIRMNVFEYFGVNEEILQNKAYGDAWQAFYEGAIEPFAVQFSEVMTKTVYTQKERSNGNQIALNANRLDYMSTKEKFDIGRDGLDRGALNIDEWRNMLGLDPLPDGLGQQYVIRGEYKALDETGEGQEGKNGE